MKELWNILLAKEENFSTKERVLSSIAVILLLVICIIADNL